MMSLQVAAALLVITGGGLMYRTVDHLLRVDPGFNPNGVLTGALSLVGQKWAEDADVRRFQTELIQKISVMPGVKSVALAGQIPLGGNMDQWGFFVAGRNPVARAEEPSAERYSVTPDYFRLMGIPLKQGRLLTEADTFAAQKVILVNETAAREIFHGESPIGKTVRFGSEQRPRVFTIVGVVGDVRHYDLGTAAAPQFYSTQEQITDSYLVLAVRADHAEALAAPIRETIAGLAQDVPFYDVKMFDARVATSVASRSFVMLLLALLGGITLILAGVGLYGVTAYGVNRQRMEIAVRMALGASAGRVVARVLGGVAARVAIGAAIGIGLTAWTAPVVATLVYGLTPRDGATIALATLLLAAVGAVAGWIPARRVARIDPARVLREG